MDLFIPVPFQLLGEHIIWRPFRLIELIVHIAISVLRGTHFRQAATVAKLFAPRPSHSHGSPLAP